ncbi:cytochrome P450 4V2-like isoform X1 [Bombyx mandarina]|uniref:Cytochrome P450 4V2-like isoform X1 n=3 Tax=Bombyx TaxID=7090 RepID=A0A6J2JQG1_BOMMA|nr:cytochrome P450 4V2-like isoform X1 [Bombyx mandarina]
MLGIVLFLIILFGLLWKLTVEVKENSPPTFSGWVPIIGHLYKIIGGGERLSRTLFDLGEECERKGGVIGFYVGAQRHFVIVDPEDALTAANSSLSKHAIFKQAEPWLGNGLITSGGSTWKMHRKLMNPAFHLNVVLGYLDLFNNQARSLVENLEDEVDKEPFNVFQYLSQTSLKTICSTAFGINVDQDSEFCNKYIHACEKLIGIQTRKFQNIWLQSDLIYRLSGFKKKEDELIKYVHQLSNSIVQRKRMERKERHKEVKSATKMQSLIDLLLNLSGDQVFSQEDIREEIDTVIVAAFDTTSWSLTYALLVLGSMPEIQEKVAKEIEEVLGPTDRNLDKDDLQKLVYTEAMIKEVLRLYNVLPAVLRHITEKVQLKNYTMYPGDQCMILINNLNRHKAWGLDVEQFRPERWLGEAELPEHHSAYFATFGIGRRFCIGRIFAMYSMKTILVHILRRYSVKSDLAKLRLTSDYVTKPVSGHFITITRRINVVN